MVTRLYLSNTASAAVSPDKQGAWDQTDTPVEYRKMDTSKTSSTMTSKAQGKSNTAGTYMLSRIYVSRRLDGAQSISGTIKGTIRCMESGANDNLDAVRVCIWVCNEAGTSLVGTLLSYANYGTIAEFNTALRAKRIADGDAIGTVSAADNNRIVMEIGFGNTTTGSGITGTMSYGDDSGTDLGDNETDTAAYNPFIELSATLTFKDEAAPTIP